jgi:hypothetical protein
MKLDNCLSLFRYIKDRYNNLKVINNRTKVLLFKIASKQQTYNKHVARTMEVLITILSLTVALRALAIVGKVITKH